MLSKENKVALLQVKGISLWDKLQPAIGHLLTNPLDEFDW